MKVFQFRFETEKNTAEISTPIFIKKKNSPTPPEKGNAIWDTGATSSMISAAIARKLQLVPVGTVQIAGVHGVQNAKCYLIDIVFQNGFTVPDIKVSEGSNFGGFDLLVGMDIIGRGVMVIDGMDEKLQVNFQFPADNA